MQSQILQSKFVNGSEIESMITNGKLVDCFFFVAVVSEGVHNEKNFEANISFCSKYLQNQ